MATYTLTVDFTGITLPTQALTYIYTNAGVTDGSSYTPAATVMQEVVNRMVSDYGGAAAVSNVGSVYTITYTPATDPTTEPNGDLVALILQDDTGSAYNYAWQYGAEPTPDTTPCPTCQALTIENCGPVAITLPIDDGDYTITLYDNQSKVAYTQTVSFTAGVGTWDSSNTAGVFSPFSIFTLTVTESDGTPVSWPVGPNEYTCARVTFSATVDTDV